MTAPYPVAGRLNRNAEAALRALPWALVVILTALNLLHAARLGPNDDAFITYRVARNLAAGLGPVFNPGERVLSITTPAFMLLLAASSLLSQDFVTLGLLWSGVGLLASGALLIDASRAGWEQSPRLAALAATVAVALALSNPLLSAAVGMETPLYLAALLGVFAAYRRALRQPESASGRRWLLATAALAAVAFLLRPDGLLAGLVVGTHWLATQRRVPWRALALGLALALPWVLFAWGYYGSPVPNTLAAKISQGLPEREAQWGQQAFEVARQWTGANPLAALLALAGLAVTLRPAPLACGARRVRRLMLLWAALYVGVHIALRVRGYFWYYVPLLPVAALLAGDGAAAVVRWLNRRPAAGQPRQAWRAVSALLVVILLLAVMASPLAEAATLARVPPPGQRDVAYRQTAQVLSELCSQPDFEPVGMAEIGILGYLSDCQVLDFSGLLQPHLAHLRLPPGDKMAWAIKAHAPPLVVFSGSEGFPSVVADQPWYRQRYEPYDIQDERGFLSVIYRRAMGPMAQRDLATGGWWRADEPVDAVSTSLVFPPGATPAITLQVFLPPDSGLAVTAGDEPVITLDGGTAEWRDVALPQVRAGAGALTLTLAGHASGQPASAAWIESNAVPSVTFFAPYAEAAAQPRPSLQLEQGDSVQATLAPPVDGPVALDVGFRGRLGGARLEVLVNGQSLGVVGSDSTEWQVERLALPPDALRQQPVVQVELRNPVEPFVRVYYVALVDAARSPYRP